MPAPQTAHDRPREQVPAADTSLCPARIPAKAQNSAEAPRPQVKQQRRQPGSAAAVAEPGALLQPAEAPAAHVVPSRGTAARAADGAASGEAVGSASRLRGLHGAPHAAEPAAPAPHAAEPAAPADLEMVRPMETLVLVVPVTELVLPCMSRSMTRPVSPSCTRNAARKTWLSSSTFWGVIFIIRHAGRQQNCKPGLSVCSQRRSRGLSSSGRMRMQSTHLAKRQVWWQGGMPFKQQQGAAEAGRFAGMAVIIDPSLPREEAARCQLMVLGRPRPCAAQWGCCSGLLFGADWGCWYF